MTRTRHVTALIVALLLTGALLLPVATAQTRAALGATTSVSPSSILPGSTGSISITLTNNGNVTAQRITTQVVDADEGITVDQTGSLEHGAIGARSSSTITPYTFEVADGLAPGFYQVTIKVDYQWVVSGTTFNDHFETGVSITIASPRTLHIGPLVPDEIAPGATETLTLSLRNTGGQKLTGIRADWTDADEVVRPRGQGNQLLIGTLGAGNETTVPIQIGAATDATPGLYALTFSFTYTDGSGSSVATDAVFGIHVGTSPQLEVGLGSWTADSLSLTVSNVGLGTATGVQARLLPDGPVSVRQASTVYLGSLDPGKHATGTFTPVTPRDNATGQPLQVVVSYTLPNGDREEITRALDLGEAPQAQLAVALDEWDDDSLTLTVSNVALGQANAVEIRLASGGPVQAREAWAVFLGNLDAGDHVSGTFSPILPSSTPRAPLGVHIAYTDPSGIRHVSTHTLELGPPPGDGEGDGAGSAIGFLLGGIFGAGATLGWGRWQRRRAAKDEPAWEDHGPAETDEEV